MSGSLGTSALLLPFCALAQLTPEATDLSGLGEVGTSALTAAPPATPAVPVAPPPSPPASNTLSAQVGTRIAVRFQNPAQAHRNDLNDVGSDGEVEVRLWGRVHPFLKWQVGVLGRYGDPNATSGADLVDGIAKIELAGPLNVWVGRMPMPSDRTSLSTEWATATWSMPGMYSFYGHISPNALPYSPGPRYGTNYRGDGATLWGQLGGGTLKYYVGVFGLSEPTTSPLYTGRLSLSLLNPEPGFRTVSTYYGAKDVLAIGVSAQHRAGDSRQSMNTLLAATDFNSIGADVLFEKSGGAAGTVNIEGAFCRMWGDGELAMYQAFGLVSYLVPLDIGIGRFQPLVRFQYAGRGNAFDAGDFSGMDAQLGYIVDGLNARLFGTYQYSNVRGQKENAILIGLQLLSHAR